MPEELRDGEQRRKKLLAAKAAILARRQEGRELLHPVDRPGVYRIEVSLRVVDRWRPWIFSNPIYVRA